MLKSLNLFFLILIVNASGADSITKFLIDFVRSEENSKFNYYGCLSRRNRYELSKTISDNVQFTSFQYIYSANDLKETNNQWIISSTVNCNITSYLEKINENFLFRPPLKHLIFLKHEELKTYLQYFKNFDILPTDQVMIGKLENEQITLFYIYKIIIHGPMENHPYGVWTKKDGLKVIDTPSLFNHRRNFKKYPIKVGMVFLKDKSLTHADFDDILDTSDLFIAQEISILYGLAQSFNATFELVPYEKYGHGKIMTPTGEKLENGSLITGLFCKEVDISGAVFLTDRRWPMIRALAPFDFWGINFFLKKPSLSYVKNIYKLTLSQSVWLALLVLTVLFIVTIFVALKWENTMLKKKHIPGQPHVKNINIVDIFFLCFENLCQQGTLLESYKISGRLLLLLLFLFFMFIYVAYSAAILLLLKSTANVNSLKGLLQSRFEVGYVNESYLKYYVENPKSQVLLDIYQRKIYPNNYFDQFTGLEKVRDGGFAFYNPVIESYKYILKNFTNYDICSLQQLPGFVNLKSYNAAPKTSGYADFFKIGLLALREKGIVMRTKVRVGRKPQCNNQVGIFEPVRLFDCSYVMKIYVYGAVSSILVFAAELIYKKYSKKYKK